MRSVFAAFVTLGFARGIFETLKYGTAFPETQLGKHPRVSRWPEGPYDT